VIGGKNKYLINGINAQKGRVENFFHSVQLNVNNPHFLIMQGRITKVLNMKPVEILSMVEEVSVSRCSATLFSLYFTVPAVLLCRSATLFSLYFTVPAVLLLCLLRVARTCYAPCKEAQCSDVST
jgi:hypothetical protein